MVASVAWACSLLPHPLPDCIPYRLFAGILRGDITEEDTVVVEAPGGEQAHGLEVYRKGSNGAGGPVIDVEPNPVELTP